MSLHICSVRKPELEAIIQNALNMEDCDLYRFKTTLKAKAHSALDPLKYFMDQSQIVEDIIENHITTFSNLDIARLDPEAKRAVHELVRRVHNKRRERMASGSTYDLAPQRNNSSMATLEGTSTSLITANCGVPACRKPLVEQPACRKELQVSTDKIKELLGMASYPLHDFSQELKDFGLDKDSIIISTARMPRAKVASFVDAFQKYYNQNRDKERMSQAHCWHLVEAFKRYSAVHLREDAINIDSD
ncbi:hypothetical protein CC2G_007065 [Coprinopsis cinerea AmutBmut pab1-1]|nr:hypothetical protein CC2G_007065 [Coprinopsis cinerea AmutBmut pab1-1]